MATRAEIEAHLNTLLEVGRFKDYGPNGLQVEGKPEVRKIVSGVTASLALIEAAVAAERRRGAGAPRPVLAGQDGRVTGWLKARLERLLAHQINLFAYHLPLDAHPELATTRSSARASGWRADARFGEQDLGFIGAPRSR